ncbi:ATP-binding protein [Streptomyces sp. NPDC026673]|uniref:ATP-binding protein n=1 Tax=Streptomyces sp. NPDC026673 TaxID=3155724 RepID=UPI0033F38FBF
MWDNLAAGPPLPRVAPGDDGGAGDESPPDTLLTHDPVSEPVAGPPATVLLGEVFLPADVWAPARARRILASTLEAWGLGHLLDTAGVVLAELVSNAVRHAGGRRVGITLWQRLTLVHLSVRDGSRTPPCLVLTGRVPDTTGSTRGLQVVSALSHRWGTELLPGGKRVWAEIAV